MHDGSFLHRVGKRRAGDIHIFLERLFFCLFDQGITVGSRFPGAGKEKGSPVFFYMNDEMCIRDRDKRKRKGTSMLEESMVSHKAGPEDELCIREEKMDVFKKVHILDENAKEVMLLRITGAFSFKEIGEIFGKNENWARVTFYRAKQKIVKGR